MDENRIYKSIIESDRVTPQEKAFIRMVYEAWVDPTQAWVDETVKESIYKHAPEGFEHSEGMYDACRSAASDAICKASVMLDRSICRAIDEFVDECMEYREDRRWMELEYQSSRI